MLVGSDEKLAACLFEQRPPEFRTSPLPLGEVTLMLVVHVRREEVTGVNFRPGVIKRDVAKGDKIRRTSDFGLTERVAKPFLLCDTIR